jgi:hypothetical protein
MGNSFVPAISGDATIKIREKNPMIIPSIITGRVSGWTAAGVKIREDGTPVLQFPSHP